MADGARRRPWPDLAIHTTRKVIANHVWTRGLHNGPKSVACRTPHHPLSYLRGQGFRVSDQAKHTPKDSAPATYQDVLDAQPHMVAEVVSGILHTEPRPAARHAFASSVIGIEIGASFGRGRPTEGHAS